MKAVLFGVTGMIGQGVLRECLPDPGVDEDVNRLRRPRAIWKRSMCRACQV